MAFRSACPRTLDRPITFFGLVIEDLLVVVGAAGILMLAAGPVVAIAFTGAAWIGLVRLLRGKPPGHLLALLYGWKLLRWVPLSPPHLVRPDWDRTGRLHFSAVTSERDRLGPGPRFYWPGGRP